MPRPPHLSASPLSMLALVGIAGALGLAIVNTPVRVIDGDTVVLAGLGKVRFIGLDTPEPRGSCPEAEALARAASARLRELLASGEPLVTWPDGKRDDFGRPLVRVSVNGRDIAETLIAEGLGKPYDGRRKPNWCP